MKIGATLAVWALICAAGLMVIAAMAGAAYAADAPAAMAGPQVTPRAACPELTRIRYFPRKGFAQRMAKGRFVGSNAGQTTDFQMIAEIKDPPPDGQWSEIVLPKPVRYRYLKYESPLGGWGNVAEIEFYAGETKIPGTPFGTTGSRDGGGNEFSKALDGSVETFFDGVEPNNQYAGIDLGAAAQAAAPEFSPKSGAYPASQEVTITCATPGAKIRISRSGGTPERDRGEEYKGPVKIEKSAVLVALAYTDDLAAGPMAIAPYRIGPVAHDEKTVRTFHIGNSLTDTVDGWLKPVAESAGRRLDFHRFTIPGAPTDWLWTHPGSGFGDPRYTEAFFVLAPIDHIFTQPFAGHNRSIENEAEHSGKFFDLCRKDSPDVQAWLYVQWPGPDFKDQWSLGKGATAGLGLKPATTWQEGVANHVAYTEAVAKRLGETYKGKPILIVPGGLALARLKTEIDAGRVPGMTDFFKETFADGIHQTAKGRYLISLVFYACIYKESPEGKASALTTGLTPEQVAIFQRIAWGTAKGYGLSGVEAK
ncbi:MAG: chitobiase/beta-hexosaminidase C-terminal domain-containing protein [Planctomycetota bacterium]|nr:chitobiase/beta-hexosaminidase C-terminal domain-containing protein [Planctomycetota bacterium]